MQTDIEKMLEGDELHLAAQEGDLASVRRLLASGCDVNTFDSIGRTPLHYAVEGEHYDVAKLLIESGAAVNAHHEDSVGNTPLGEVAGRCSLRIAKLLVDSGADPTIRGWMQLNALDRARERKRGDGPLVYDLLLERAKSFPKPLMKGSSIE